MKQPGRIRFGYVVAVAGIWALVLYSALARPEPQRLAMNVFRCLGR